jgi:ATP adenylyltransferase
MEEEAREAHHAEEPSTADQLKDFLKNRMRMSHIYQPVMLRTLLVGDGRASTRDIAAAFLALDQAQIEYYEQIVKQMPGRVLHRHGLVERDGDGYRLTLPTDKLTDEERADLVQLCNEKVADYLQRRGDGVYDHRRTALGDLSGTVRYEVLKRAGFRCELCGISADERRLEVDHIHPRKHGGSDSLENLQALCWLCNANKGARDATDFRAVRAGLNMRHDGCIFCALPAERVSSENTLALAFRDAHPVTPLHTLVIPKRHVETWFDLTEPERRATGQLLDQCRDDILGRDKSVSGFNIGMNSGPSAGQTVMHAHVHLIPRRHGDVEQPRGGVRGVVPGKQSY